MIFLKKCKSGENNPVFFFTVVDQFLLDLPRYFERIKQAVTCQNSEAIVERPMRTRAHLDRSRALYWRR